MSDTLLTARMARPITATLSPICLTAILPYVTPFVKYQLAVRHQECRTSGSEREYESEEEKRRAGRIDGWTRENGSPKGTAAPGGYNVMRVGPDHSLVNEPLNPLAMGMAVRKELMGLRACCKLDYL